MKDRFDIKRHHLLLGAAAVILLLAQLLLGPGNVTPAGLIVSILFLAANTFLFSRAINHVTTGINMAALLLFISTVLSFAGMLSSGSGMAAALLMNLSLLWAMRFFSGEVSNDLIFLSTMSAGVASIFFPPLVWMLPVLLLLDFAPAGDKARYVAMAISGFVLPLLFYAGYTFMTDGYREVLNISRQYSASCIPPCMRFSATGTARAIKVIVLAVVFAVSAVSYFRKSSAYSVSHSRAVFMLLVYSVMLTALLFIFSSGNTPLNVYALTFPVTIVIYDYLTVSGTGRNGRLAFYLILLALALEFLTYPLCL